MSFGRTKRARPRQRCVCKRPSGWTLWTAARATWRTFRTSLQETLDFIERDQLYGQGCGWIDLQRLASTRLTANAKLWTLDQRLCALELRFGVLHQPATP